MQSPKNVVHNTGLEWSGEDMFNVNSFEELTDIGLSTLHEMGSDIGIVCGPLSTGGKGSGDENKKIFTSTVEALSKSNKIFDQIPFENSIRKLLIQWQGQGNAGYCMPILEIFYARLFESGLITRAYFIPGWESSFGARWEHEKMKSHGVDILYLTEEFIENIV